MAGGIGSRYWPMSRQARPKQFIDILGVGETLLQATFRRAQKICPLENILVVTSTEYTELVQEQLPTISKHNILSEPSRKNTAPCIAYAGFKIQKRNTEAVVYVAPSDHLITNEEDFYKTIQKGFDFVAQNPNLLTLGIKPSRPDIGYGYIQFDASDDVKIGDICDVKTFTEKPSLEIAKSFVQSGEFVWNSGMFLWKNCTFLKAFELQMPEDYALFSEIESELDTINEANAIQRIYGEVKNISVDYAIMEKSENISVLIANFGWSDLGTWGSLYEQSHKDENGNVTINSEVLQFDSKNNIIATPKQTLVVLQGIEGCIVAEYNNALLICKMEDEQKIKQIVNEVRIEKGDNYL